MKKVFFLLCVSFICLQGCGFEGNIQSDSAVSLGKKSKAVATLPLDFRADWSGQAMDGPWPYDVAITLKNPTTWRYQYYYPTLSVSCIGSLTIHSISSGSGSTSFSTILGPGTVVIFKETLNTGESYEGCLSGGYVRLRKVTSTSSSVQFSWLPTATSLVTREYMLKK